MYIRKINRGLILFSSFTFLLCGLFTFVYAASQTPAAYPKTDDDPPVFTDVVSLPVMIPDTTLVAEQIVSYDGHFVEDGSEEQVEGIAALYLHNSGSTMVASCKVILRLQSGIYRFEATCVPPGATVLVQEKDKRPYMHTDILSVGGSASLGHKTDLYPTAISIERYYGGLKVGNISKDDYGMLCISHKNYCAEENVYIGGVTYVTYVPNLNSGESCNVWPVHFSDSSKIVCITGNKKVAQ